MTSENTFHCATNTFHGSNAAGIVTISAEFHPLHTHLFKSKLQQEILAVFIQSRSLEYLAIPGETQLKGTVGQIDIVKTCASSVLLRTLVEYYKRIFFFVFTKR